MISDLTLHGALIYLDHSPKLQSELQVQLDNPGIGGSSNSPLRLRGYVVRIEQEAERSAPLWGLCSRNSLQDRAAPRKEIKFKNPEPQDQLKPALNSGRAAQEGATRQRRGYDTDHWYRVAAGCGIAGLRSLA